MRYHVYIPRLKIATKTCVKKIDYSGVSERKRWVRSHHPYHKGCLF